MSAVVNSRAWSWWMCGLVVVSGAACAPNLAPEESPAVEAHVQALESTPACQISELSWTTGTGNVADQVCAGPWQYLEDTTTSGPCTDNGTCTEYATCRHWDHESEPVAEQTKKVIYQHPGRCDICMLWDGTGSRRRCVQWEECEVDWNDVEADRAACTEQGRLFADGIRAAVTATWTGDKVRSEVTSAGLGWMRGLGSADRNGVMVYQSECSISYRYSTPKERQSGSCSCLKTKDEQCSFPGPLVTRNTATNLTRAQVPANAIGPRCTTCQDLPLRGPQDAQALFSCLSGFVDGGATEAIKAEARRRIALVFERFGDALDASSYERARSFATPLSSVHGCGAKALEADFSCLPVASRSATSQALSLCQRLSASHVSAGLYARELPACFTALSRFTDEGGSCSVETRANVATLTDTLVTGALATIPWTSQGRTQLQTALARIHQWYEIALRQEGQNQERTLDRLSPLLASFWTAMYADTVRELGVAAASDRNEALVAALSGAVEKRTAAQLAVLDAVFSPAKPLPSPPLLSVVGDALLPLLEGLAQRGRLHDVACRFQPGCANQPSEVSALYALLASVLTEQELDASLQRAGTVLPEAIGNTFRNVRAQHATLRVAHAALVGRSARLTELHEGTAPRGAESLASVVRRARAAARNFAATGFFQIQTNSLHFGIDGRVREQMLSRMSSGLTDLVNEKDAFGAARKSVVQGLVEQLSTRQYGAEAERRAEQLRHRTEEVVSDLAGLRARDAAETLRLANTAGPVHALFASPQVENALTFSKESESINVSGASARLSQESWSVVSNIAVLKDATSPLRLSLEAKDRLRINVSGSWSPTCAISKVIGKSPVLPFGSDASEAVTGPEGFWMESVGGQGKVRSLYANEERYTRKETSRRSCVGLNGRAGIGFNVPAPYYASVEATASTERCESTARGTSKSTGTSTSDSTEQRSSARFNMGLRVEGTPFVKAPAGALLLVALPRGASRFEEVRDVIVAVPGSVVMFDEPSDVYLVVNDRADCDALDTRALNVALERMRPVGALAEAFAGAQAEVAAELRDAQDGVLAQGSIGANELASLRARANATFSRAFEADLSRLPVEVATYFAEYVDTSVASLERKARQLVLLRELDHLRSESLALRNELLTNAQKLRLGELLLNWHLLDLAAPELEDVASDYMRLVSEIGYPVLNLRHPTALANLARHEALTALRRTSVNASFDVQVNQLIAFGRALETALATNIEPEDSISSVTVAIPRPGTDPEHYLDYRAIDPARAAAFWSAVDSGKRAPLEITLRDVYEDLSRDPVADILLCNLTAPVIEAMGVFGLAPSRFDAPSWNSSTWSVRTDIAPYLVFPDAQGSTRYDVASGIGDAETEGASDWLTATPRMTFGNVAAGMADTRATWTSGTEGRGLSPFAHFTVDLRYLATSRRRAVEVVFMMFDVRARRSSKGLTPWFETCADYQPPPSSTPPPAPPVIEAPITQPPF